MAEYRPAIPFNVPAFLLVPDKKTVRGVLVKEYKKAEELTEDDLIFCSFRTFGGTEIQTNKTVAVEDTATVETWFNPKITADCRLYISEKSYEVIGTPENINMQNRFLKFKVRAVEGGG